MKLLSLLKSWFVTYFTPSPYPSHARMQQLHDGEGEPITRAEWNLGAHYCPEFDYMFTFGERPEGGCYCRPDIGEYQSTHTDHCLATHPANYEPCEHEFDPEPHGSRDTFVPPPVKCDNALITEFESALDKLTDESLTTTNNTMMTPSRWLQLTMNGGHITPLERMEGWHYCPRLDDKLTKMQNKQCKLCGADHVTNKYPKAVHKHNDQWWFWEESHTVRYGPFNTEKEADDSLNRYCVDHLGEPEAPEKDPVLEAWKKELEKGGLDFDRNVQDY